MRAAQLTAYGSAENIKIVDVPEPSLRPGQVLIHVAFGGLRFSEVTARINKGALTPPFILGTEVSGTVIQLADGVNNVAVGDRVIAQPLQGGYAELLAVEANRITKIPDRVPPEVALLYRVNGIAAYLLVYEWAKVKDGEKVLVHAAAGGVGRLVTQLLKRKLKDVVVIGLASTDEKVTSVLANGADHAINYKTRDYLEEVQRLTGGPKSSGGGVNVVFNGVGAPGLEKDPKLIRPHGRWVIYGRAGGSGPIDVFPYILDSITIMPFSMLTFMGTPAAVRATKFLEDWMVNEELDKPTIHSLDDVAKLHAAMERGETHGKIVFRIGR
jgi:NADPH2:quinone reductase